MCCVVLLLAFARLKKVSQRIKMAVNGKVMGSLIFSYCLALLSQLFYLFSQLNGSKIDLSVTTCLVSLSVGVSQTILMFIFLIINSTEQQRK